jgi:hypothetical protein
MTATLYTMSANCFYFLPMGRSYFGWKSHAIYPVPLGSGLRAHLSISKGLVVTINSSEPIYCRRDSSDRPNQAFGAA